MGKLTRNKHERDNINKKGGINDNDEVLHSAHTVKEMGSNKANIKEKDTMNDKEDGFQNFGYPKDDTMTIEDIHNEDVGLQNVCIEEWNYSRHKDDTIDTKSKEKMDDEKNNPTAVETENAIDRDDGLQYILEAVNQLNRKDNKIDAESKEKKDTDDPNSVIIEGENENNTNEDLHDIITRDSHRKLSLTAFVKVKNIHVEGQSIFVKKTPKKPIKIPTRFTRNRNQTLDKVFFYG